MTGFASELGVALRAATRLLTHAAAAAEGVPGIDLDDFGPVAVSAADRRDVLAGAPLYLAAELESAGVIEACDTMAGLFVSGALPILSGPAAEQLEGLWEGRHGRYTGAERAALFARLFGAPGRAVLAGSSPVNREFPALLGELAVAVAGSASDPVFSAAALARASGALIENLAPRLATVPDRVEHDALDALRVALAVFRQPDVQHALGASDARHAVDSAVRRFIGPRSPLEAALARGAAGQVLLGWVATSFDAATVPPAVLDAAIRWARATSASTSAGSPRVTSLR
jgi:hypothetical protein